MELLVKSVTYIMGMADQVSSIGGIVTDRRQVKYSKRKACPSVTICPMWTALRMNLGLQGEKPRLYTKSISMRTIQMEHNPHLQIKLSLYIQLILTTLPYATALPNGRTGRGMSKNVSSLDFSVPHSKHLT
jgi:hypothetical protein